jgi:hypothetical protein
MYCLYLQVLLYGPKNEIAVLEKGRAYGKEERAAGKEKDEMGNPGEVAMELF